MKGNRKAYAPVSNETEIKGIKDVFRQDAPEAPIAQEDNPLVMTSVRLRVKTRNAAKLYAVEHGMKMQEVLDEALKQYLGLK